MNNGMGDTLIRHHRAEHHFRYLRFDAEHDKLVATQPLLKALLIKFVLLPCQTNATIALIRHPLARMRRKKLRQIVLKCPERFGLQVTIHDASVQTSPSLYPKTAAVSVNRSFENRFHPADFLPQADPSLQQAV